MHRVLIIGCGGSGKTTLARRLTARRPSGLSPGTQIVCLGRPRVESSVHASVAESLC